MKEQPTEPRAERFGSRDGDFNLSFPEGVTPSVPLVGPTRRRMPTEEEILRDTRRRFESSREKRM